MSQEATSSSRVVAAVENFLQMPLGLDAVKRVSRMSVDEFAPLRESLETNSMFWELPERPPGFLRPYLFVPGVGFNDDMIWQQNHLLFPPLNIEQKLLYFHEVAVADPVLPGVSGAYGDSGAIDAIRWLAYAKPMINAGLVHLQDWRLRRSIFSDHRAVPDGPFVRSFKWVSAEEKDEVWALLATLCDAEKLTAGLGHLFEDSDAAANLRRSLLGTLAQPVGDADFWMPGIKSERLVRGTLGRLYALAGRPVPASVKGFELMERISNIELPRLSDISVTDFISIRQDEEVFKMWQDEMALALRQIPPNDTYADSDLASANERLKEAAVRVRSTRRRQVKKLFTAETRTLALGMVGAGVSAAIFGARGLAAAATAGSVATAAKSTYGILEILRSKSLRAARRHFGVFDGGTRRSGWGEPIYVSGVPRC